MKISILHPSRSRPDQALHACHQWVTFHSGKFHWEYILSLDATDPELSKYERFHGAQNMRSIVNDNQNVVQAANQAARLASGEILVLISDDFMCFKGWDLAIIGALKGKSGVLKTFDGIQKWIVTLPIMTQDYYQDQGYLYDPECEHMFCDTIMTHRADLYGKLIIRNDIKFEHAHYSVGKTKKDAVNIKADKTWDHGERVYIRRCLEKFGLPKGTNIYNLSAEANQSGHLAWMRKRGIPT